MKRRSLLLLLWLILVMLKPSAPAQDTAFTYHGRLAEGNGAANGNYDFQFRLYAVPIGGLPLGVPVSRNNAAVSNGLFTVSVDFGAGAFSGADRWLEIAVRTNGVGTFTVMLPRHPITSTPYAIRALSAGSVPAGAISSAMLANGAVTTAKLARGAVSYLDAPDGSPTDAVVVNTNGLVGVGTSDPQAGLDIAATAPTLSARRLFQVQHGMSGYTNLGSAASIAVVGNLLVVSGYSVDGVTVIDISNPQTPVRRSQFRDGDGSFTNLNSARGLAMKTNLLAVAANLDNAVTLVSLTNPASPVVLAELRDGIDGWNELAGAWAVAISGDLMAIGAYNDNAVTLADISNPSAPIKRAELKDGALDFPNLAGVQSLAFSGNLLAIGANLNNAVTLVDVTDPANPVKQAELMDGADGYNLNGLASVALRGGLLAIAAFGRDAVTLVSVTNPASPVKLAELKQGVAGVDWLDLPVSVAVSGNWLAVGSYLNGTVGLLDIADPSSPRPLVLIRDDVGGFNYLNGVQAVAFAGTNLAMAAVLESALTLASFPPAAAGLVSQGWLGIGTVSPAAALNVVGDVVVQSSQLFDVNADRVELGMGTVATGPASTAIGHNTAATGSFSTAIGQGTIASGPFSTAMGGSTVAAGDYSTALGYRTAATGDYSTAIGSDTTASGSYSTAMGSDTAAIGDYSIAMGRSAQATNQGSYVWADSTFGTVRSTNNNSVTMRASGGYRLFSNNAGVAAYLAPNTTSWGTPSDRAAKKNFQALKGKEILEKLAALPIQRWNYKWEADQDTPHIGPVAQDFKAAFYPGRDDKSITTLEFDGVALAAIQGLNQKVEDQRADIQKLRNQNQRLQDRLQRLEALLSTLQPRAANR
jgi:hypothetical protein